MAFTRVLGLRASMLGVKIMAAAAMLGCISAAGAQTVGLVPKPAHRWQSVNTQGMGFVTGGIAHPLSPHHLYIRTDVGGAYRFDRAAERWIPITDTVVSSERPWVHGIESIAVAPRDPNRVAIAVPWRREIEFSPPDGFDLARFSAEVLVSDDAGATWQSTGLSSIAGRIETGPNGLFRGEAGERLAIDPQRSDIFYFATRNDGLWRKTGSAPWSQVPVGPGALPDPAPLPGAGGTGDQFLFNRPGYTFVVFDPRGEPGTASSTIYVGVWGSGVWRSTNAGATWQLASSRPYPVRAAVGSDGTVYVSEHQDFLTGGLSKIVPLAGGSVQVTPITPVIGGTIFNRGFGGIAVDPKNPSVVLASYMYGYDHARWGLFRSTNAGVSWTELIQGPDQLTIDRPGYYLPFAGDWGRGMLFFDPADPSPSVSATAYAGNGFGVIRTQQLGVSTSPAWSWLMNNLEEAVVHDLAVTTKPRSQGGPAVILAFGDVLGFSLDAARRTPSSTIVPIVGFPVPEGSSIDFSWGQPDYVTFLGHNDTGFDPYAALSTDGGRTFAPFPSVLPGAQGGRIALATNDGRNMVWMPASFYPVHFTRDGGQTWTPAREPTPSEPGDVDTSFSSWQVASPTWKGQVLAASPVLPGTFYLWSYGRLLASTDGGENWFVRYAWFNPGGGDVPEAWSIDSSLIPHPSRANELWLTTKPNDNQVYSSGAYRSTDGGYSFRRIAGTLQVNYLAFGKGYDPGEWIIYIHGSVLQNGILRDGIFRSLSEGTPGSWEFVGPADNRFPTTNSLAADPREPGIIYVGTGGRGAFVGHLAPPHRRGPSAGDQSPTPVRPGGPTGLSQ